MNETFDTSVAIVDDDPSVRQALARLLRVDGNNVQTFSCAQELLQHMSIDNIGCLVLDLQLPDLNGLELQAILDRLEDAPSIVFISGHGDIPITVRAMQAGAIDFLPKPFEAQALLDAVARALEKDRERRTRQRELTDICKHLKSLTPREQDVLRGVVAGLLNKQIAARLDICEKTVKIHRAHVMEKMCVRSVAELVHITEQIGLDKKPFSGNEQSHSPLSARSNH